VLWIIRVGRNSTTAVEALPAMDLSVAVDGVFYRFRKLPNVVRLSTMVRRSSHAFGLAWRFKRQMPVMVFRFRKGGMV
jgi:hypothetical protein